MYVNGNETYKRSLENHFYKIKWIGEQRYIEDVTRDKGKDIVTNAYEIVRNALTHLKTNDNDVLNILKIIASRNWEWLERDAEKFRQIYKWSISIIPPDQYFSVYLTLTEGCAWNKCTFCKLYRDRPYRVKSINEFRQHIKDVKTFFGRGLETRRTVFLGDANAINVDQETLVEALREVKKEFSKPVYSFVDAFTTPKKKDISDFIEMKKEGLKRLYIGLESGSEKVLSILNKPMKVEDFVNFVISLKNAGLSISIIVIAGVGGRIFWNEHVNKTAEIISRIPLDKDDLIYISPLVKYKDVPYARIEKELGLGELNNDEILTQTKELKSKIKETFEKINNKTFPSTIAKYDLKEFVY